MTSWLEQLVKLSIDIPVLYEDVIGFTRAIRPRTRLQEHSRTVRAVRWSFLANRHCSIWYWVSHKLAISKSIIIESKALKPTAVDKRQEPREEIRTVKQEFEK